MIVGCVVLAVWGFRRSAGRCRCSRSAALAGARCSSTWSASADGLGFVPGMLIGVAVRGVGSCSDGASDVRVDHRHGGRAPSRWSGCSSTRAVPDPQWGAATCSCRAVCSWSPQPSCSQVAAPPVVATVMVAVLVTGFGLAWLSVRSHWAAHGIEQIVDRHDQAVISGEAHVLREGGAFYEPPALAHRDRRWRAAAGGPIVDRRGRLRVRLRRDRRGPKLPERFAATSARHRTGPVPPARYVPPGGAPTAAGLTCTPGRSARERPRVPITEGEPPGAPGPLPRHASRSWGSASCTRSYGYSWSSSPASPGRWCTSSCSASPRTRAGSPSSAAHLRRCCARPVARHGRRRRCDLRRASCRRRRGAPPIRRVRRRRSCWCPGTCSARCIARDSRARATERDRVVVVAEPDEIEALDEELRARAERPAIVVGYLTPAEADS